MHYTDRTWLVTGASSGLGRAIAEAAHDAGARVVATARALDRLKGLPTGDRMLPLELDLSDTGSIDAAVDGAEAAFGPIDVLVNNAGYGLLGAVEETTEAEARAQLNANFFGPAYLTTKLLPGLRERKSGAIINVSSVSGVLGAVGSAYYAASKHALEGWSDALRAELKQYGIAVLVVEPGAFRTQFFGRSRVLTECQLPGAYPAVDARRNAEVDSTGAQPGDPARGAAAIIQALAADPPPKRLIIGAGAVRSIRKTLQKRLEELEDWRELSESADSR